ncbi:MAG: glycosyltransferase family 9 protein [Planctomycetes bacterium]|nr:glycosyltransferase family 9 protein [Planctomycetota bacterium]
MSVAASTAGTEPAGGRLLPRGGRVLVIRMSALGDVLFALETVAALARERPDVTIDFLVEDRFASLLQDQPQIAELIVYPRRRWLSVPGHLLRLWRRRYDVVLDLHGIQKSALHLRFLRAPTKLGFLPPAGREGAHRAANVRLTAPTPLPHRADLGHLALRELGLSGVPARAVLAAIEPPPALLAAWPRPRILLHPGTSSFAAFKRWPAASFAALAQRLKSDGVGVAVSFGPGEEQLAAQLEAAAPGLLRVDGRSLGLRGLAGVCRHADVVVAADTGPLHIAAAMGTRCVALFGPKDHTRYGPREHDGIRHEVLFADVPCRPCTRRSCVSPQCVLRLQVDDVAAAVHRQLEAAR